MRIDRGAVDTLPDIATRFPDLHGLNDEHELLHRLLLTYDTRDSLMVPTQGTLAVFHASIADRHLLSSVSYSSFGFDIRHYKPLAQDTTLVAHVAARYTPQRKSLPFWVLSRLGGDRSIAGERQALRGYGEDRYIDNHLFAANLELRHRFVTLNLFSTRVALEVAPFLDTGQVFRQWDENPLSRLHWAGGVGFRAIAKPQVVGYVDAGYGEEGLAVFSGIDYPF
jgi:outer membrane translocation and assembly module TamA